MLSTSRLDGQLAWAGQDPRPGVEAGKAPPEANTLQLCLVLYA